MSISVGARQVAHLTFLELQDQQTLPAMTFSEILSSMKACQPSISTLTASLSRAGPGQTGPLQVLPSSSPTAMRLTSLSLAYRSAVLHACACIRSHLWQSESRRYTTRQPGVTALGTSHAPSKKLCKHCGLHDVQVCATHLLGEHHQASVACLLISSHSIQSKIALYNANLVVYYTLVLQLMSQQAPFSYI